MTWPFTKAQMENEMTPTRSMSNSANFHEYEEGGKNYIKCIKTGQVHEIVSAESEIYLDETEQYIKQWKQTLES